MTSRSSPPWPATIPVLAGAKQPPLVAWEVYQSRLPTTDEVAAWRTQWPDCNWAMITGMISGVVVLDIDPRHGGDDAIRGYALPPTHTVRTPHGGWHYYYRHPGGRVPNAVGLLPGVDLRGDGGFVLKPPSIVDGRPYEVVTDEPLAPLPQWILERLAERAAPDGQHRGDDDEMTVLLHGVDEGQRDVSAVRLAGHYIGKGLPVGEVLELLRGWNLRCRPPMSTAQLIKCVESIHRRDRTPTSRAFLSSPHPNGPQALQRDPVDIDPLTVLTAKTICALPDPDQQAEVLGALVGRGTRTLIGAHTGHGKTTLTLQIIKAIVTGVDFLGWRGAGGRALIVDAEQGLRTIQRRLRETGLDQCDAVDYLRVPDGLSLDKRPEEADAIETVIASHPYEVVSFDPLYKLHGGNSNDEREAVDLMRLFDRWREMYRFALLLATHTRKPPPIGARFTMHEFFGSSAYLRGAEVVLGLEFLRSGFSRLHFFKDRDGDLPVGDHWGLLFDKQTGFTRAPDAARKPTAADKVYEILMATPGMTEQELQQETRYAERTIRDALSKLQAVAVTGYRGEKTWSLPSELTPQNGELPL